MKKHLLILVSLLCSLYVFYSCNTQSDLTRKEINQEYGNIQAELIDSLNVIKGRGKSIKIDPSISNTVVGEKGTILIIPQNTIVDQKDNAIEREVFIRLKESFSISDYILSNLQTVHNDRLLESNGMIYFTAHDKSGNKLKIADNKTIRIQIPQPSLVINSKIFLGNRDNEGLINWEQFRDPAKTLIPYPIKFISKNRFPTECFDYYGITTDTIKYKYYNYYGNITDFENTLLATKEFADRFNSTCWKEILEIYINNLGKNLWEIDEMVVQYFIKDSIENVESVLYNIPPNPYGSERTQDQKNAHKQILNRAKTTGHTFIELYKSFALQKLGDIDTTKHIDTTRLGNIDKVFISYDAMKFGWVNVDFFYDDPKAIPIKLIATTNERASLINLVLEGRNVILSGFEYSNNEYWFTKNKDGFNKLPKGEKATLIAIGLDGDKLIFGTKEIVIGENELEKIQLSAITGEELIAILEKYES